MAGKYLYAVDLPWNRQGFTSLKPQIEVFDINAGHKWVKNIPLPGGIYNVRGVAASAATGKIYIAYFSNPNGGYQPGGLLAMDLNTNAILWNKVFPSSVVAAPDRFAITPDGKKIYMPAGENGGSVNYWRVLDAATGNVLSTINFVTAPHDTLVSLDGRYAFLEGQEKGIDSPDILHTVGLVDTSTDKIIRTIGPFQNVVRPYTVNGSSTLLYATENGMDGFQVADITTGKVLYTANVPNSKPPPSDVSQNHGIALTPDEKEIWLCDTSRVGIHVFDVSGVKQGIPPKYVTFIPTRKTGKDLNGNIDPNASNDTNGVPAWITTSIDGRYMYPETGEIISVAQHKVIGQLRPDTIDASGNAVPAPYTHSRFMLEVDFNSAGKVVQVGDQYGVGRVP